MNISYTGLRSSSLANNTWYLGSDCVFQHKLLILLKVMLPQLTVPKLFSLVAAPHGIIDVYHSIDHDKKSEYVIANVIGTAFSSSLWVVDNDIVMGTFMIMSAYHWRHQFDVLPKDIANKYDDTLRGIPLVLSSMFVGLSHHEPMLIYIFLTFIHTPHQYYQNRELLTPVRLVGIIGLTYCTSLVLPLLETFYQNPIAIGFILGHILYQELVVENTTSVIY